MRALRRQVAGIGGATQAWRWPVVLGVGAAALLWVVWYFTVTPCTMDRADDGMCNPGITARFINHQILAQCILLSLPVAAVKGGYDEIMVSRERKRADAAEQRAEEAEERLRQERKRTDELIDDLRAAIRMEREARQAESQAMINTMGEISSTMAQLLARQQNGRQSPEN